MKKFFFPIFIFITSCSIALYNIGNFPKMIGDEGIYVSQAYWLTHFGSLGPYTYWYDHFPLGWAQIGLWQLLAGVSTFFDNTVLSSRVLMGLVLGGTTTFLYLLTKKLTDSKIISFITSFIYISSALTLTFGRMVLLDNLAIFWFLLSMLLLVSHPTKIKYLALSGLTFGLSILTKESLLFFLPAYLYLTYYLNKNNAHIKYALLINYVTTFFLLLFFPLLALVKHEFFPGSNQVSFIETLLFQSQRGTGIPFWQPTSHFRLMLNTWIKIDPLLLILGTGSTFLSILLPLPTIQKIISTFSMFFLIFLLRGGQIYEFYIIPLIPLFVLNLSFLLGYFHKLTKSHLLTIVVLMTIIGYTVTNNLYPFTSTATATQMQSLETLKELPPGNTIVSNNYTYLDLYLEQKNTIEWYQKVESDPSVRKSVGQITHILTDFQFDDELTGHQLPFLENLLKNKKPIAKYGILPTPGQNIKPYTNEFLSLYALKTTDNPTRSIISLENINSAVLSSLTIDSPYAILITHSNFNSTLDLEEKINLIKATLPSTQVLVSQDSEGHNSIPWINTNARSFFKSSSEALEATSRKSEALSSLGFTGAIIATSMDHDGYLQAIIDAAKPSLTPYILYMGDVPSVTTNLIVKNNSDLETVKLAGYSGPIFLMK